MGLVSGGGHVCLARLGGDGVAGSDGGRSGWYVLGMGG